MNWRSPLRDKPKLAMNVIIVVYVKEKIKVKHYRAGPKKNFPANCIAWIDFIEFGNSIPSNLKDEFNAYLNDIQINSNTD